MPRNSLLFGAVGLAVLGGCSSGTDSASADVAELETSSFQVLAGSLDGPPPQIFDNIRGVAFLSDGRFVVADGGSNEIRVFEPDGSHVVTMGGHGEGPGEFGRLDATHVFGDTIFASDSRLRRLSVFLPDGSFGEDVQLPISVGSISLVGSLSDGQILLAGEDPWAAPETGNHRMPRAYISWDRASGDLDTLAVMPSGELYVRTEGDGWMSFSVPFARSAAHAVGEDVWYAAAGDDFVLRARDAHGEIQREFMLPDSGRPLDPAYVTELRAAVLEQVGDREQIRQNVEMLFENATQPDTHPALSDIVVGDDGRVWVSEWSSPLLLPELGQTTRWRIFSTDGVLEAVATLPRTLELVAAGNDWAIGISTDELGVERVARAELTAREF